MATPVHHLVPGSMATDGDVVGGAPLVGQTPTAIVVLARQPQAKIHPQGMGQKAQGPMMKMKTRVTMILLQGGRVQPVTEI